MAQNWAPEGALANAVYMAGFQYDPDQDIIFSRMDAWQRGFGYGYAYDIAAPVTISAIIDCEPFFFHYDEKDWMIELWKGQYGLETGAEIGVYVSTQNRPLLDTTIGNRPHDPTNSKFFDCANDDELLNMSFTLNRKGEPLFQRGPEDHWWLTGFKWGILSAPEDLTMDLGITIPKAEMRKEFVASVEGAGYQNITIDAQTVRFTFDRPTSVQPRLDPNCEMFVRSAKAQNSQIVENYQDLESASNDPNGIPDDFAAYFNKYNPKHFNGLLATAFQTGDGTMHQMNKAFESLFKQTDSPLSKFFDHFVLMFKKFLG